MSDPNNAAPDEFIKIVYKQLMPGDWAKIKAESNLTQSGGGAQDLRFRKLAAAELKNFFPGQIIVERRRTLGGAPETTSALTGSFFWEDGARAKSSTIRFEDPTPSRPGEMRIAQVDDDAFFRNLNQPAPTEGSAYLLFALKRNGEVWTYMVTDSGLNNPEWHPEIRTQIRTCAGATSSRNAVSGVIDLLNPTKSACNADA